MRIVAPSILSADFGNLERDIKMIDRSAAEWVHIDIMDGVFVPNISFGFPVVRSVRKATTKVLDVHLMIVEPERYVIEFAEAGADIITVHAEATTHLDRTIQLIKTAGKKCGVSLNPHTPLNVLEYVLDQIDMVLLMSVNPGYGGQSFIPYSVRKAQELKTMIDTRGLSIDIEMDGGLGAHNAKLVADAGVNVIVAGNSVFAAEDPKDMISRLKLEK